MNPHIHSAPIIEATGAPFFLEHCSSIFEFEGPARFVKHEDGGFFVSEVSGEMVKSLRSWGFHSDEKMKKLQEQSKLPNWGRILVSEHPVEYKYKDVQLKNQFPEKGAKP